MIIRRSDATASKLDSLETQPFKGRIRSDGRRVPLMHLQPKPRCNRFAENPVARCPYYGMV
jgi:hypothetical protein